jgi:hypothetical protein
MSYDPFYPSGFLVDDIGTYDALYYYLYVSFFEVSHIKFLINQCQQSYMLYHLVFPIRFLEDDI